ncbi:hypothetical protein [Lacticaseibacillus zeae]|uniref:Uncharacterized protein n=1 Tax=Lacticaseibacillus zeae subsp. silagei TaxID=3068307 RepID=A0ABD7ZC34_LACZE|nr:MULTISPECIES: hypothetical protein [Lacticaseibacillus]OFR93050.1 hypothetical protein HMPREF2861_11660 [Lactobacillus sp. HMSC068F07]MDE3316799.1 hypothetical protein [Lacticaseibacillus zeae]MDE3317041.1 hypothetical protein [Lacticaseibacillus zeae]WLV84500.1 hypothetical protein LACZS2_000972 [Lacticaseibacillus sp. NCIMB 15475]WLV87256.1 hypothetical protein LACZS1_000972 [Lacticaseibacillus sp. NCIMB 15474]
MKEFEYTASDKEVNRIIEMFMLIHKAQIKHIQVYAAPDDLITVRIYYQGADPETAGVLA